MNKYFVSVIVPYHLSENSDYLRMCLASLARQSEVNFEVIVLASEGATEINIPDHRFKWHHFEGKSTFSKKINKGIELASKKATHYMLASDDIILSRNSLANLLSVCKEEPLIVNPMSNCDMGYFYGGSITLGRSVIPRFLRKEELSLSQLDEAADYQKTIDVQIAVSHVCFYATMIPKNVWDVVGKLDESYRTGKEDVDYCLRAKKLNINCVINFNAFALHFGGVTSSKTCTTEDASYNSNVFKTKWGFDVV